MLAIALRAYCFLHKHGKSKEKLKPQGISQQQICLQLEVGFKTSLRVKNNHLSLAKAPHVYRHLCTA